MLKLNNYFMHLEYFKLFHREATLKFECNYLNINQIYARYLVLPISKLN